MKTDNEIKQHGGKRPGSGRKALDHLGTIVTTIRLTGEQKAAFDMLGGIEWLRHYLDSVTGNQQPIDVWK